MLPDNFEAFYGHYSWFVARHIKYFYCPAFTHERKAMTPHFSDDGELMYFTCDICGEDSRNWR